MLKKYGIKGFFYLLLCLMRSKLISRNIRLIRFPIDIRYVDQIDFGKGLTTGRNCRIEAHQTSKYDKKIKIFFGDNIQLNDNVHISACKRIVIGNNVLIASKVFISDSSHGDYSEIQHMSNPLSTPSSRPLFSDEVKIGDNCWIGENVCILKGVQIGCGSIVGANSLVNRNVPEYSIVVGSPAKVIKTYCFENKIWKNIL